MTLTLVFFNRWRRARRAPIWRVALAATVLVVWSSASTAQPAPSRWKEANALTGAIGGWRVYARERAKAPEGYPLPPQEAEALWPEEVFAAAASVETTSALATWEGRRFAERSAPLAPPTLSFARKRSEAESSQEYGIHLPIGGWIGRARTLAADDEGWGGSGRLALRLLAGRNRLALYAEAVGAKAELAQAMDRLEVQKVLEELTSRQRQIGAVPESELLSLRMDGMASRIAFDTAREVALQAAERLALELGWALDDASAVLARLPMDLRLPQSLPPLEVDGRLDIRTAMDSLDQEESNLSRNRTVHWFGGLEVGLLRERSSLGETADTVELSWRLPFGGETSRQTDLGERIVAQLRLQLDVVRRAAEREQAAARRAKALAETQLLRATAAADDAETWMEEQMYRYSGMLIGPHDLLRAASRLRALRSALIAAQRQAFVATVDAHYAQAIPMQINMAPGTALTSAPADGGH